MSSSVQLNHVAVIAQDYELSRSFYLALGLSQIVASPPRYARFEASNGTTFSIHVTGDVPAAGTVVFFETNEVDSLVEHLKQHGATAVQAARDEHWLWREARVLDPAGNLICLFSAGEKRRFPPWRLDRSPVA